MKTHPLRDHLRTSINRSTMSLMEIMKLPAESSHLLKLASLLYAVGMALRLFKLGPQFVRLLQVAQGRRPSEDKILYATRLTQSMCYVVYQFLENCAFLTDLGVLSGRLTSRWTSRHNGRAVAIYKTAHRAWFIGVNCDFVRLFREAQLEKSARKAHDVHEKSHEQPESTKKTSQWYTELCIPLAWFPLGWQLADWNESGFPGFNLGMLGTSGIIASVAKGKIMWKATT